MNKDKLKKLLFDKPDNIIIVILNVIINISWVFLLGLFIDKSIEKTLVIIIIWSLCLVIGKAKHYSSPLKCFLMQVLFFSCIFVSTYINIYVAILFTIYTKLLLSGWTDIDQEVQNDKPSIKDLTLWSGKKTQYQDIIDYIKYNPLNDKIKEFEEKLQDQDNLSYLIYKYRFKDLLTFQEISDRLDIETNRITEIQDKVAFTFRVFIGL